MPCELMALFTLLLRIDLGQALELLHDQIEDLLLYRVDRAHLWLPVQSTLDLNQTTVLKHQAN